MKKGMELILLVFAISFLTSCGPSIIMPKTIQGSVKTYNVNNQGTVEIIGQEILNGTKHWIFVNCDHWSGCYIRCQGKLKSCKKVATDSKLEIEYTSSNK